jgi:uncharacterized protein YdcH (DUF465 family)
MHEMDIATTDSLKEELINRDPEFRELAREHHKYEERLSELSSLAYPSDEEQLEEITLKKKKLALKDQMYSMMLQYQKTQSWTTKSGDHSPSLRYLGMGTWN